MRLLSRTFFLFAILLALPRPVVAGKVIFRQGEYFNDEYIANLKLVEQVPEHLDELEFRVAPREGSDRVPVYKFVDRKRIREHDGTLPAGALVTLKGIHVHEDHIYYLVSTEGSEETKWIAGFWLRASRAPKSNE